MDSPIAKLFKESRARLGISQQEAADRIGKFGRHFVLLIERNKGIPSPEHAPAIAEAFKLPEPEVIAAIMATKYPGLRLAAQPMKRAGVFVELTPQEQKRLELFAASRDWPTAAHYARKVILQALDAQEDKKK